MDDVLAMLGVFLILSTAAEIGLLVLIYSLLSQPRPSGGRNDDEDDGESWKRGIPPVR